jgi:hypothetical protein
VIKPNDALCRRSNVPTEAQLLTAIDNNVFALLVSLSAVFLVALFLKPWSSASSGGVGADVVALGCALVVGWALYSWDRTFIRAQAHLIATTIMFGGIVLVVLLNAIRVRRIAANSRTRVQQRCLLWYWLLFAGMASSTVIIGIVALTNRFDHAVFWLEASLITLFGAFWAVQTTELW